MMSNPQYWNIDAFKSNDDKLVLFNGLWTITIYPDGSVLKASESERNVMPVSRDMAVEAYYLAQKHFPNSEAFNND